MVRKNKTQQNSECYVLPSQNDEMRTFVNKFKIDMMENVISNINFAIENNIDVIEVFQFKNSPFVVTIAAKEFESNLKHIHDFYKQKEFYELCPRIERLQELLQRKNDNEKQKTESTDQHNPEL